MIRSVQTQHVSRQGVGCWVVLGMFAVILAGSAPAVAQRRTSVDVNVSAGNVNVGVSVTTRGPVHEAFAEPVVFEPEPGFVVSKAPPPPLEEMVPDQRPVGEDVQWVPGYWSWDDESDMHVWVSGIWRSLPPNRAFVPGYWAQAAGGHQWVAGFWMSSQVQEVEYLPPPPAPMSLEPVGVAPAPDHLWVPGVWMWRAGRYVWRPGYWLAPQVDWVWVPSHYVWTPSGYVFVNGYWDYVITRRGLLFAPVVVDRAVVTRPNFVYTPSVVINTQVLVGSLFARPRYMHYYFGDYFAPEYARVGIVPVHSFHRSHRGYSSVYVHTVAVERRRDPRWEERLIRQYELRRDRPDARPPRTWSAMERARASRPLFADATTRENLSLARSLNDASAGRDLPVRLQATPQSNRDEIRRRSTDLRQVRDQRRQLELDAAAKSPQRAVRRPARADDAAEQPGRARANARPSGSTVEPSEQPVRLRLPRSHLTGRSIERPDESTARPGQRGERRDRRDTNEGGRGRSR